MLGYQCYGGNHEFPKRQERHGYLTPHDKRGNTMSKAAAVLIIARLKASRPRTVAALARVGGRESIVAVLLTLSLVLLGEGLQAISTLRSAWTAR
jgi:hypothetical protein